MTLIMENKTRKYLEETTQFSAEDAKFMEMAIRNACAKLGTFQLTGCTVYSSCEPCPMCLSALYWAGVSRICYGNTKDDAKAIDFDDSFIYDQLELSYDERSIRCEHFMRSDALRAFRK